MFRLSSVLSSVAVLAGLVAAAPALASPLEYCIKSCVQDYYPFHHPCVAGCVLADLIWGNSGIDDNGGQLTLTKDLAARSKVSLAAGTYDASGKLALDPTVLKVQLDYAVLNDYLVGRPAWVSIGAGVASSRNADWEVTWDASKVGSGDYLVRATYYEARTSREAMMALTVP